MISHYQAIAGAMIGAIVLCTHPIQARESQSLAGEWGFQFDPEGKGIDDHWQDRTLSDRIALPGTTAVAGKGDLNIARNPGRLTPRVSYVGAAWYERSIDIPAAWIGKRVRLFLERTKPSRVWLDGRELGSRDSLLVPHVYDIGAGVAPGRHRLSILINNDLPKYFYRSHAATEETQTNWHGILGRIELQATDRVWINSAKVFSVPEDQQFRLMVILGSIDQDPVNGTLTVSAALSAGSPAKVVSVPVHQVAPGEPVEVLFPLGEEGQTWDEFSPSLYQVKLGLDGTREKTFHDSISLSAGLRAFSTKGTRFQVNGRLVMLRGKHDACVFPLTGHPPMDKEGWLRVMRIARSYGVNHYRFHSWTPPHAAFEAADELGIYMQPELPFWGKYGEDAERDAYLLEEAKRILDEYGNHPSFVMMTLGNENGGSREIMASMVAAMRAHDPRHLYAQGSNNYFWDPAQQPGDDFWTTMRTRKGSGEVRGSLAHADAPLGPVQAGPPNTMSDFSKALEGVTIPVIGHEIGQYQVFPDLGEIEKYTGVLEPRNFEIVRDRLKEKGMLSQADDFKRASGQLAAICYKADMEYAFRTSGFGGFHLLDLQDFPGQGTALVGVLNAFMESKGLVTPEIWRESCSESVLQLRLPSYTWTSDQIFEGQLEVAHYGRDALSDVIPVWELRDESGSILSSGKLGAKAIPQGRVTELGGIRFPLSRIVAPARLELVVKLENHPVSNRYPLWVYPEKSNSAPVVKIVSKLDKSTLDGIENGDRVLLSSSAGTRAEVSLDGFFATDFWCYPMFRFGKPPGTMGLLMDPRHPALAEFPTEFHSNWQWFDIAMASHPLILDSLPPEYRPVVQVIDNFDRCHRLGLVSEFRHGEGCLLVVACDLPRLSDRPAARQLLASLSTYLASDRCRPGLDLPETLASALLDSDLAAGKAASASSSQDGRLPASAVDGSDGSRWCAADASPNQWWQVDLGASSSVSSIEITWEQAKRIAYRIEGSPDGSDWKTLSDQSQNTNKTRQHHILLDQDGMRFFRILTTGLEDGQWASISTVNIFGHIGTRLSGSRINR